MPGKRRRETRGQPRVLVLAAGAAVRARIGDGSARCGSGLGPSSISRAVRPAVRLGRFGADRRAPRPGRRRGLGVTMLTRRRHRRTADGDASSKQPRRSRGCARQGEPDEVGLGRGNRPAVGDQRLATRVRSLTVWPPRARAARSSAASEPRRRLRDVVHDETAAMVRRAAPATDRDATHEPGAQPGGP